MSFMGRKTNNFIFLKHKAEGCIAEKTVFNLGPGENKT